MGLKLACRVLLIYPRFVSETFWNFAEACELKGARYPAAPLGLITAAAMLPPHWEVRLVDRNTEDLTEADLAWADMVMTGGMLPQQADTVALIELCRRLQVTRDTDRPRKIAARSAHNPYLPGRAGEAHAGRDHAIDLSECDLRNPDSNDARRRSIWATPSGCVMGSSAAQAWTLSPVLGQRYRNGGMILRFSFSWPCKSERRDRPAKGLPCARTGR